MPEGGAGPHLYRKRKEGGVGDLSTTDLHVNLDKKL